jgi:serine/threonine protein kinase/WD40 repeat protein
MTESPHANNGKASSGGGERHAVDVLANSFLARLRRGECPSISEYTFRNSDVADEIQPDLNAPTLLEKGGECLTGRHEATESTATPQRIAEYHILREVGRGGMGVVYEAEHHTMRRRVALKVLPMGPALHEKQIQRFYLEARVAGRLHHTNIVPVFEVGADADCHYYAMQFIRGQSLDIVLAELQRIQQAPLAAAEQQSGTGEINAKDFGKTVAFSLVSSPFKQPVLGETEVHTPGLADDGRGVGENRPAADAARSLRKDPQVTGTSHVASTGLSQSTGRPDDYFRRVAKVGLEIAEALAYAHSQGILHRDIKPSNVILDTGGTAWITDFGLAKDEDQNLTRSGDIVGTFRYMAPERFDGQADARSDVYGLGLTLYELCTLRIAFSESDRGRLVRDIRDPKLARPRSVNPQIPRDLETIILKATETQRSKRYQAARHLAEDLRLFLADRPIRARRTSVPERIWRWGRRNPQQAVLAACVFMLLAALTVGALAFGYITSRQAQKLAASRQIATERLYQALCKSAESAQWSGRPGQQFSSIGDLASAAGILPQLGWDTSVVQHELVQLRSAAIAAMSLADMRLIKSSNVEEPWGLHVVFDPHYTRYAQADRRGNIAIRSVEEDVQRSRLPAPASGAAVVGMKFSPDGRYLAVGYQCDKNLSLHVWDTTSATAAIPPIARLKATAFFDFDPSGSWIALGHGRLLTVLRLADGVKTHEQLLTGIVRDVQAGASDGQIAVLLAGRKSLLVCNVNGAKPRRYDFDMSIEAYAWHPLSGELAIGGNDGSLRLVRLSDAIRDTRVFEGHTGRIRGLHFSPHGELLISHAWDGTLRLWQGSSGEQLLRTNGLHLLASGFSSPDGRFVGTHDSSRFQVWEIARETPLRILRNPRSSARRWSVDFDPTGRWLASARDDGVELWNTQTGKLVDFLPAELAPDGNSKDAEFLPDGSGLLTSNAQGLQLHAFESAINPDQTQWSKPLGPQTLHFRPTSWIDLGAKGDVAAFREDVRGSQALIMSLRDPSHCIHIGEHPGMDHIEMSPDGRWAATSTWGGRGIHVWNAQTGERVTQQPLEATESRTNVTFSPDSKHLVASTTRYHVAWHVETWETLFRVPRRTLDDWPGPLEYSPDGQLLAASHSRFELALLDARTGREVAVLAVPSNGGFHDCSFSPNGTLFAAASDTEIQLWDLGQVRRRLADLHLGF